MKRLDSIILAVALVLPAVTGSEPKLAAQIPHPVVEVYSGPAGNDNYLSKLYTVEVFDGTSWLSSYTYSYRRKSKVPWHENEYPSVNFTTFGTNGPLKVRITRLTGPISSIEISPKSKKITATIRKNVATFTLKPNHKVWITVNHDDANPLFVFADEPKPPVPDTGPGVVYFGPGVTTINRFKAENNQVIYLDGGAWVRGSIDLTGTKNVQIMGPGVLSGELWNSEDIQKLTFEERLPYTMLRADWNGRNMARVKSITIVAAPFYNFWSISDVYSVKELSPWHYEVGGFESVNHVDQSFSFVGDNVFVTAYAGLNQDNITITNSFAGNTNNSVICGGFWGNPATNTYTALIDNVDIKTYGNPSNWGQPTPAIFQIWVDNTDSSKGYANQTYQNIRIEGNLRAPMAQLKNMVYPWGGPNVFDPPLGNSHNLTFKNISLPGSQRARSEIKGLDSQNGFHNVTFQNLTISGKLVTSRNFRRYFDVNSHVSGLSFIP